MPHDGFDVLVGQRPAYVWTPVVPTWLTDTLDVQGAPSQKIPSTMMFRVETDSLDGVIPLTATVPPFCVVKTQATMKSRQHVVGICLVREAHVRQGVQKPTNTLLDRSFLGRYDLPVN